MRVRTILWCRADPGMRIRARRTAYERKIFITMTRGSGSADPGARTVIKLLWWRADPGVRIRVSGPLLKILMMTRGSGSTDPGVRTVKNGSGSTDPGVTPLFETWNFNFISGSTPVAWIQKTCCSLCKILGTLFWSWYRFCLTTGTISFSF